MSATIHHGHTLAQSIIPLIMCGGAGTRLWPASREGRPKQFLPLFGPHSTFQETIRRVSDPALFGRPIIVTNNQYRFLVAEQLAAIGTRPISCLNRCAAISDRLSSPARRICAQAHEDPSSSRWPPTMSLPMRPPSRKSAVCGGAAAAEDSASSPSAYADPAGDRIRLHPAGRGERRRYFRASRPLSRSRTRQPQSAICSEGYLWNSGNFMFRADVMLARSRVRAGDRNCGQEGRCQRRLRS